MKKLFTILLFLMLLLPCVSVQAQNIGVTRAVAQGSIPGDNTMRFYRLAIPVTFTAFKESFDGDYNNVTEFWQECEEFVNTVFVPLGICFDVVVDNRLVMAAQNAIDADVYNFAQGTTLLNNAVGSDAYDVGMWVHYRDILADNTGLGMPAGAYQDIYKGSAYAKTDVWVVAHELGHMFGALHTGEDEGSIMVEGGEFFSYPSIKLIRDSFLAKYGNNPVTSKTVQNTSPLFTAEMKNSYRIPKGSCFAIPVYATDADGHTLTYSAIGCSSATVGNLSANEGSGGDFGENPHFASLEPQTSNIIDYRPKYTADVIDADFFYDVYATDISSMSAGSYSIAFLVNDIPSSTAYDYLVENPFYSNYAVWDATVEIVDGTAFTASVSPAQNSYSAGQSVTVNWGVNSNYFGTDSKVRITMSANYGKTFDYLLADNVSALSGSCIVNLPNVNVGNVDVDFQTATRSMRGGIIRVEEIGGVAYSLTSFNPNNGGGFTVTGGSSEPQPTTYTVSVSAKEGGNAVTSVSNVQSGGEVTLTATPDTDYKFIGWYNGDAFVSSANPYTFNVTGNVNYTARFDKDIETFDIKVNSNNAGGLAFINTGTGTDVTTGSYPAYTMVTLMAVGDYNNSGYIFEGWYKDDKLVSTEAEYTFTVEAAVTYEARFFRGCVVNASSSRICYATIYDADGTNPSPGRKVVVSGTKVLFDAYIDPYYKGYVFVGWGNSEGKFVSDEQQYLMTVTEDVTLMAVAELAHYQLTVSTPDASMGSVIAASATVEPGTSIEVGYGTTATISAIPNSGYAFVNWTLDGKEISTSAEYAIPVIDDVNAMPDVEYVANFKKLTDVLYNIDVTVEPLAAGYIDLSKKEVEDGGSVTLTANANEGYEFVNWTLNGEIVGTETVLKVDNVTKDLNYVAHYKVTDPIAGRYFRLRDVATGKYLNLDNEGAADQNAYGQVNVVVKDKESEKQIIYFEKSGEGYKLKSKNGYYIKCEAWNVDTDADEYDGSVLLLEETDNVGLFYIKWDNYYPNDKGILRGICYFKVETVKVNYNNIDYVFCDAAADKRATWVLEEVADKSALQALITETTELFNEVAETKTKINIAGKITSNAGHNVEDGNTGITVDENDGAGIAGLTDGDASTYFHSRWKGTNVNEAHYLQINLGEGEALRDFCFEYAVRGATISSATSPAPTEIEVRVSADGNTFGDPVATYTSLPAYTDLGRTLWLSDVISSQNDIRSIRLTVTNSAGPNNNIFNSQKIFAMGTLNLYSPVPLLKDEYKNYPAITEELLLAVNTALENANSVNNNDVATTEQVEEARLALLAKKEMLEETIVPSSFTLSQVTANELMEKTEPMYIAVKNISGSNNRWFAGTSNVVDFSNSMVLVWEPVVKGQKGSYYIRNTYGKYIQKTSPLSFGAIEGATVFTAVNATTKGSQDTEMYFNGDNGDTSTLANINTADDANLVRFVTGTQWINVESSTSTPTYRQGYGGYTVHFVYEATNVDEFNVKVGEEKFATFYSPVNVELPDNATAYIINGVKNGNYVNLVEVEGDVLAANTAILLYSETPVECKMPVTNSVADSKIDDNKLYGTVQDAFISKTNDSSYYILSKRNGDVGMYNPIFGSNENKFMNRANKVYLMLDKADAPSESVGYRFLFPNTTAIDTVENEDGEIKAVYDLSGRKLESITDPGIYIVNGKKIMLF